MDPSVTHMHSTLTHSSLQITPESGSKTKSNKTVLLVCATVTGFLVLVILVTSALIFVVVLLRKKHSKEKNQQLDLTNPNYESCKYLRIIVQTHDFDKNIIFNCH